MNLRLVCTFVVSITLLGLQAEEHYRYCGYWKYIPSKVSRAINRCKKEKRALMDDLNRLNQKCDHNGTLTTNKVNEIDTRCEKERETLRIQATSRCKIEKETPRAESNRQSSNKLRILARQLSDCLKKPNSGTCSADVKCFWDSVIEKCIPRE